MFGYLKIQKEELLVREFEAYKAVYCRLCRQMGRDYSFLSRLSLSYDCTFYAMLLMSIDRSCTGFSDGRCVFNPLKKCKFALCASDCFSKAAAFSVISGFYKLKDNIEDGGFFKKLLYAMMLPVFSIWRGKAVKSYGEIDSAVSEMMLMQHREEHSESSSVDSAAHPTGCMLAAILSFEGQTETQKRVLYEFGYQLGRWIYLIDAADDLKDDLKKNNFNPFSNIEKYTPEYIESVLNQSLARAYEAYKLIDLTDYKGILDNMLLMGFPAVQNKIISKLTEVTDERSI